MDELETLNAQPEEETTTVQQVELATVGEVAEDGLTLVLEGTEEATTKKFKCNTGFNFTAGQRVVVLNLSGSKVAAFGIGAPGSFGVIPAGGTAGQVLTKSSETDYALKWATPSAGTVSALTSGSYTLTLSSTTLTPSSTGFTIGTPSKPVKICASTVTLYYSTYKSIALTCSSAGKLLVGGTAIN